MKTLGQTLLATILTALVLTSSAFTSLAMDPQTEMAAIKSHNKIWISGNVKLVLTQGEKESVIGTNNFDPAKTSVSSQGQTLYINSMEAEQVTIRVTLKDLQRIEAYGQSVVVTSNNFDVKYLQLFLSQNATAKISAITGSLYTVINDNAVLKMSGAAHQHTLVANNAENVKYNNFFAVNKKQYALNNILAAEKAAMNLAK
ncbi:MAG: DUF2807 domain-containing protein [Bacteroidota bacterium]